MRIAVFGSNNQRNHLSNICDILKSLQNDDVQLTIDGDFHKTLCDHSQNLIADCDTYMGEQCDVVLSFGGDGTLLRTAHKVASTGTPILGINTGNLGYLTAANIVDAKQMINAFIAGDYKIEERTLLEVSKDDGEPISNPFALNEVAILRQDISSVINIKAVVNGLDLTNYKADGLIVSTPTGSTAYNLSCGGPILEPTAQNIVLTPVSPHSLTMRPLVLCDDSVITLTTSSRAQFYQLSIDGRTILCPEGSSVIIKKARHNVKVVQTSTHNFAETLRNKLSWGN